MFILLCCPVFTYAQWGSLARQGSKAARQARSFRMPSPSALRASELRLLTPASQQFAQMERMVRTSIVATPENRRAIFNEKIASFSDQRQYAEVIEHFNQFKKEADVLLYYQAKPSESRPLEPEETRQWIERIHDIRYQIQQVSNSGISQDETLLRAQQYLNHVLYTVAPGSRPLTLAEKSYQAANRVYNSDEFFLHEPTVSCWQQALRRVGISCGPYPQLPEHLNIVIFNDAENFIEDLQQYHQNGQFFPDANVVFLNTADEVRQYILHLGNYPDLILADMNTSNGLVGPALAQELRANGFKGDILALTGFDESQLNGTVLLELGLDGLIPRRNRPGNSAEHITQFVKNYYYYRDLHGWQR